VTGKDGREDCTVSHRPEPSRIITPIPGQPWNISSGKGAVTHKGRFDAASP